MRIRNKILVYFSILSIGLIGVAFLLIYSLFSSYRTEEFQQRIKDQTRTALKFLVEVKTLDYEMMQTMDRYTINNLYSEKITLFDEKKELVYSSIADMEIAKTHNILMALSEERPEVVSVENGYDIVGIYMRFEGQDYFGVAKAYDEFGLSKLSYLRYVLLSIYMLIVTVILVSSYLLSKQISQPIKKIADEISHISLEKQHNLITVPESRDEIQLLASHFNTMMNRLNEAYAFQKHAIHHISHELKTPIAILVSNFEKMESETDPDQLQKWIRNQKEDTKNLSDIINALLELSKVEAGTKIDKELVRIDELVFDVVEEVKIINPDFTFEVSLSDRIEQPEDLSISGNTKLLRLVFTNLAINCQRYSSNQKGSIRLDKEADQVVAEFMNLGEPIQQHEQQFIFQQFFRGENSKGKRGFGLGLMLINKIVELHHGKIEYINPTDTANIFKIRFPLR